MDYTDLASHFSGKPRTFATPSRIKAAILCNPHNPIGRVWTKEELTAVGETVIRNDAVVISDEIHCEILFQGYRHVPFATISEKFARNCIICMAPSKTFNLPGMEASSIVIPNKKIRDAFTTARSGMLPGPNIFGYAAMEAAYRYGDDWLAQVLEYLQGNLNHLLNYFTENIPQITVIQPQGTYLIWLDCRRLGLDGTVLDEFFKKEAHVGLNEGSLFGTAGNGFMRMNIACPRVLLDEALDRIKTAVNSL
jgi:cystathionine beta-lyase